MSRRRWIVKSTREGVTRTFAFAAIDPAFKFANLCYMSGASISIAALSGDLAVAA